MASLKIISFLAFIYLVGWQTSSFAHSTKLEVNQNLNVSIPANEWDSADTTRTFNRNVMMFKEKSSTGALIIKLNTILINRDHLPLNSFYEKSACSNKSKGSSITNPSKLFVKSEVSNHGFTYCFLSFHNGSEWESQFFIPKNIKSKTQDFVPTHLFISKDKSREIAEENIKRFLKL